MKPGSRRVQLVANETSDEDEARLHPALRVELTPERAWNHVSSGAEQSEHALAA